MKKISLIALSMFLSSCTPYVNWILATNLLSLCTPNINEILATNDDQHINANKVISERNDYQNQTSFKDSESNNANKDYAVEDIGLFYFKGTEFDARRLIFKSNNLALKMKFSLMHELLDMYNRHSRNALNQNLLVVIISEGSDDLNNVQYCVSSFPRKGCSPKMYFYEKEKDVSGYGFGRPIGGVYATGDEGDFDYKDTNLIVKTEYPKNLRGITPKYKFPNFELYCEEHGSPGVFKNCKLDFSMYNSLKNWANHCWKPSQIRLYNSSIVTCRGLMHQSYLAAEDVESFAERLQLIIEDCKPKMIFFLSSLKDKEVSDFILAEFEFLEWDLGKIDTEIWLMKNLSHR